MGSGALAWVDKMIAMKTLYLLVPLLPLAGAIVAGLFGATVGRAGAHWVTILSVLVSFLASCVIFADVLNGNTYNGRSIPGWRAAIRSSRSASWSTGCRR
jgi:NADH-quinone oxidoreductase subunit L